ncbi:MAG: winged helix DNA-binding domain-containing protein [Ilumatobacteraceae bacterium]
MRHFDVVERRHRLLARHHLAQPGPGIEEVAEDLVGLHSSDPATVVLSLRSRLDSFRVADLENALYERRSLLRMLAMRRTMFVVPLDLAAVMQSSCAAALVPAERRKLVVLLEEAGVSDDIDGWIARLEAETLAALAEHGTLPASKLAKVVPELATQLQVAVGKPYAGTIGLSTRLLFLMSTEGKLARGRPLGSWISSQYRWAPMEDWIGSLLPIPPAEARAELIRRWLRSYGPGTLDDLTWWTKWTKGHVRAALTAVDAVEVTVNVGDGVPAPAWLLADDLDPAATPMDGPIVNLLPSLDPTVMGWKQRSWYLGPHAAPLFDWTGNAGPTIWVDGRAVGLWSQRADGPTRGHVVTRLLEPVERNVERRIAEQAAGLTEWMDGVRVTPRFPSALEKDLAGRVTDGRRRSSG